MKQVSGSSTLEDIGCSNEKCIISKSDTPVIPGQKILHLG